MPEASKDHQVFISYNNDGKNGTDFKTAQSICKALESKGITCWIAPRDVLGGRDFAKEISKAISNVQVMVLVLSSQTGTSLYVRKEIHYANKKNVPIIPFCVEEVELDDALDFMLMGCQWVIAYPGSLDPHLELMSKTVNPYLSTTKESPLIPKKKEKINQVSIKEKSKQPEREIVRENKKIEHVYIEPEIKPDIPPEVQKIKSKAKKVYQNDKGFWEAEFEDKLIMIHIPEGDFIMGNSGNNKIFLDGYWIGKYTVTFAQYDRYCIETNQEKPEDKGWGRENRPVIYVSWDDAKGYSEWLTVKYELDFTLPSEAQWEKAARGTEGFEYPWGNEFNRWKCNSDESGVGKTQPVGSYLNGVSPYGALDMAGNVWEWCFDWFDDDYYKKEINKNPMGPKAGSDRVMRGGSWFLDSGRCRTSFRVPGVPRFRNADCGFRLVGSF